MKKVLSILLAVLMLLSCIPATAETAEFPALDRVAAWDFLGDWFAVSGLDVMGDPTTEYPEVTLCLYINGLGDIKIGDEAKQIIGWYVEDGTVFLAYAPDNVPDPDQIFAYAYKNETGRLVVDLLYASAICEQEGEEYIDATWPEFNAEDAKYFIGTWAATTYVSSGEEVSAELAGEMTLVLNDDGSALAIEGDEDPCELRWYTDYAVAYAGENLLELMEISFDGTGNIIVKLDAENSVIMAPAVYEEAAPVNETGTILGTWEDSSKTVEITEDGKLKLVYKSDGYTNHMSWEIVDGMPTVTLGTWKDATIQFIDGQLIVEPNGLYYAFTRVGAVPDIYVGPGGFVVSEDDASTAYLGDWHESDGRGVLTFNGDFTSVMNFTDGRVYEQNWKLNETGAEFTSGFWSGTSMVIEDENTLNIGEGWMILYRDGTQNGEVAAQPIGPEGEAYFGVWALESMMGMDPAALGMSMELYLNEDGTCSIFDGYEHDYNVWTMENGVAMVDGAELTINADGKLTMVSDGAEMVFTRGNAAPADGELSEEEQMLAMLAMLAQMAELEEGDDSEDPSSSSGVDFVPGTADDFIGGWIRSDNPDIQILLLEGEANLIDGTELYTTTWTLTDDGVAEFDGMKLYIQEDWSGILEMDGELVAFERGYVEKPKASASTSSSSTESEDEEMSEEDLLALLALLSQAEGQEGGEASDLPEHLQPYVGTWHLVYLATGGLEGDLRDMGITGTLELNADGTGKLSGAADDSGSWYDDEGTVRFGQAEAPLTLLGGGFLRYGNQLSGYMIFSQDEEAVYEVETEAPAAPVAPAAPAAPASSDSSVTFTSFEDYLEIKFVATTYTSYGTTLDATTLGVEYALTFHENGTCDFVMAGINAAGTPWGLGKVSVGLTQVDAFVLNYYGTAFNCIPTETGFDMDFYGTMTLHFTPVVE